MMNFNKRMAEWKDKLDVIFGFKPISCDFNLIHPHATPLPVHPIHRPIDMELYIADADAKEEDDDEDKENMK
uniref:Uncharacterized protein n=1 Tax=Panagrolaimus davidi TaxID=227884 RepID=A0A914R805_9BILA